MFRFDAISWTHNTQRCDIPYYLSALCTRYRTACIISCTLWQCATAYASPHRHVATSVTHGKGSTARMFSLSPKCSLRDTEFGIIQYTVASGALQDTWSDTLFDIRFMTPCANTFFMALTRYPSLWQYVTDTLYESMTRNTPYDTMSRCTSHDTDWTQYLWHYDLRHHSWHYDPTHHSCATSLCAMCYAPGWPARHQTQPPLRGAYLLSTHRINLCLSLRALCPFYHCYFKLILFTSLDAASGWALLMRSSVTGAENCGALWRGREVGTVSFVYLSLCIYHFWFIHIIRLSMNVLNYCCV